MSLCANDLAVLKKYPRAVYHMRSQLGRKKLLPIFGAGVGKPVNLPNWPMLIDRISEHADVKGSQLEGISSSNTSKTQMLYQHFRAATSTAGSGISAVVAEHTVRLKWTTIIHECLYRDALDVSAHPYLRDFAPVIRRAPLTVNYNFDDYIEQMFDDQKAQTNDSDPYYESVWDPAVQYRSEQAVIYHPNGFLPRRAARGASPTLVFADDSFADQMIDVQSGHYSTLLSHLFRYTGVLIGLSLEDPTLKHLLRQNAHTNPGHVHYYVAYVGDKHPSDHKRRATSDSNFETYNLITLYMTTDDIKSLGRLLSVSANEFERATIEAKLPTSYVFFISGAVGVGKTTAVERFKSLSTFDEWMTAKHELLLKSSKDLTSKERIEVDDWINKQFATKNIAITTSRNQLCVVDRSLFDPLAFTPKNERKKRLDELRAAYDTGGLVPGRVILLIGNAATMHVRTHARQKQSTTDYLSELQETFIRLWGGRDSVQISSVDTIDRSIGEVVRAISRVVHLDKYETTDQMALAEAFAAI